MSKMDYTLVKRDWIAITVFIIIVFIFLSIGIAVYSNTLKSKFSEDLNTQFKVSTLEISHELDKMVASDFSTLSSLSEIFNAYSADTPTAEIKATLVRVANSGDLKRVGIADSTGQTLTNDNSKINVSSQAFFLEAWNGTTYMTDVYTDEIDGEDVITNSTPIYINNKTTGVLFLTRPISQIQTILQAGANSGDSIIISPNGDIVLVNSADYVFPQAQYKNIYTYLTDTGNTKHLTDFKESMLNSSSGHMSIKVDNKTYYMYYTPMSVNNWTMLYMVDASKIAADTRDIVELTSAMVLAIVLTFIVFLICLYIFQTRNTKMLEELAFRDDVTGINNKNKFKITAEEALLADDNSQFAFVHFDIDKFKIINENLGFYTGNAILKGIAAVLEEYKDTFIEFARVNNDNFVALAKYQTRALLSHQIQSFFDDISKKNLISSFGSQELSLTMGLYEVEDKSKDINKMMDRANIARESIKGFHKSNFTFYNNQMREGMLREKQLEDDMENALSNQEFVVYYQPKHKISTGTLMGSEALVRWKHPLDGIITPATFIPIFEKNGSILKLDEYVFERVCMDIKKWLDNGYDVMPVSVNFSKAHLYDINFVDKYKTILDKYNLSADYLELEITENFMIENLDALLKTMLKLNDIGFKISMDDFGSGYSSLNMLKDVPVSCIKLDRVFLIEMDNLKGKQIIEAVVNLAKKMGITVVAEGVETKEQLEFLKNIECEIAQGYYFDRPLTKKDFETKMQRVI